ncbi:MULTISPECIES: hypothetical protein [unclassified Phaeobacter]|uniref:hypothetical protein n=1 Tax=unclassified Phaeobacter TaxID=2621772 RepID=UPI003A8B4C6B
MKQFIIRALYDWQSIAPSEVLELPVNRKRHVKLEFNVTDKVQVWIASDVDMATAKLLAASDGHFGVEFSADETMYLQVLPAVEISDAPVSIYIKTHVRSHVVHHVEKEAYTNVAPTTRRNSDFDRMMMWAKLNEQSRQTHFDREIKRLNEKFEQQSAQHKAATEPQPTTEKTPQVIEDETQKQGDTATDTEADKQSETAE